MTNLYTKGGSKTEVQEVFRKQAKIFMEYGADLLIAEV